MDYESAKLCDLINEYRVDETEAINALKEAGFKHISLHLDVIDKPGFMFLTSYRDILSKLPPVKPRIKPVPPQKTIPQPKLSDESQNNKGKKSPKPKEQRILTRDYIIITMMAMRKKGLAPMLNEMLRLIKKYKSSTKIVFVSGCLDETRAISENDSDDENLRININLLYLMIQQRLAHVCKGEYRQEDNVIGQFLKNNFRRSIVVVGNNFGIARTINYLNGSHKNEKNYKYILERDLDAKGFLVNPYSHALFCEIKSQTKPVQNSDFIPPDIPDELNCYVTTQNAKKKLYLRKIISDTGAEGTIYATDDPDICIKIFKHSSLNQLKLEKVKKMCTAYNTLKMRNPMMMDKIAWPEELVYFGSSTPVGYVMKFFGNTEPLINLSYETYGELVKMQYEKDNNILIGEKHVQVKYARSLSEIVNFLHSHNVILCDINRGNLLISRSSQDIFLVDIDSAQIADKNYYYPTNVGRSEYLSPEHISNSMDFKFIRKPCDDVWILQNLLFYLLTPFGKPYMKNSNETEEEMIKYGKYPFQAGTNKADKDLASSVGGTWHQIVSHFPFILKFAFWDSFHHNGKNFAEDVRLSASDWLDLMISYEAALPKMKARCEESLKYIPKGGKPEVADSSRYDRGTAEINALIAEIVNERNNNFADFPTEVPVVSWDEINNKQ